MFRKRPGVDGEVQWAALPLGVASRRPAPVSGSPASPHSASPLISQIYQICCPSTRDVFWRELGTVRGGFKAGSVPRVGTSLWVLSLGQVSTVPGSKTSPATTPGPGGGKRSVRKAWQSRTGSHQAPCQCSKLILSSSIGLNILHL